MNNLYISHEDRSGRSGRGRLRSDWRSLLCVGILLLWSIGSAPAQRIYVTVNGDPVPFVGLGPVQQEGRTLVPVRGVLEKLGAEVAWVPQSRTVIASTPTMDIQLHLGDRHAMVNGKDTLLDIPAQEIGGHTMVPLRFLGEALGADVRWDGQTRTVIIVTRDQNGPPPAFHKRPTEPPIRPTSPPLENGITPSINSFTQDTKGWLRPGETIRVMMEGTPGGQAAFRIPGLIEEVPMRETSPGRYIGTWRVPEERALQLPDAAVIGSLKLGAKSAPLLQASGTISIDAVPPRIHDRTPEPDSRVTGARPNISAEFDDQGSGIDRSAVHLLLNGQEVTQEATVSRGFISYTPSAPLPAGTQKVQLVVSDKAGNRVETVWNFMEEARAAGGIKKVIDNADRTLEPGDTLHVEMTGSPEGKASFSLGSIKNIPMPEMGPGRYIADYTIRKGDDVSKAAVSVHLITPDGQTFVQQSERAVTVKTGRPTPPVITYPGPDDALTSPLVIKGKATPNTEVHIKVDYRDKVLGALAVQGSVADTIVKADRNGIWQTEPINLKGLLNSRNVEYTISATATNASDESSERTSLRFRIR
jgi:hypothetical protein